MAQLRIALVGPLQVTLDDNPVTAFRSEKVRALLAYLAMEADRPHRREFLAEFLWPDQPERAAHNLRHSLYRLREAIEDREADPPYLLTRGKMIQLNPAADHWVDVKEFFRYLDGYRAHCPSRIDPCDSCMKQLQQAVALYQGEFLEGLFLDDSVAFEEWLLLRREEIHQSVLDLLHRLALAHQARGEYEPLQFYARRQLELEPWREEAHRQLMLALAMQGQRRAALAQYAICEALLAEELGVKPTEQSRRLYEQIREGTISAPAPPAAPPPPHVGPPPHDLPAQLTPFFGRERELAQVADRLLDPAYRLVTLAGPGGIGKTRLALEVAAEHLEQYRDGVFFVPLADITSGEYLIPAIGQAIGYIFQGPAEPEVELLNYLQEREMLLVLDNFEHLVEHAPLVVTILQGAPRLRILISSRERLNLQAESVLPLQGLPYPDNTRDEGLRNYSAVALFMERADRRLMGFSPTPTQMEAIARICQMLEGLPLGIELASAWVDRYDCQEIEREVARSLDFLAMNMGDLPPRQRSLRAVFEHSWNLLSSEEQHLFASLSIFRGGFDVEAAAAVSGGDSSLLAALVDKSLLRESQGRYAMQEALRQFAEAKLVKSGRMEEVQGLHLNYYLALAEEAAPALKGARQVEWLERLSTEQDNLRVALQEATATGGPEVALRLTGALRRFWEIRGHFREGQSWFDAALKSSRTIYPGSSAPARVKQLRASALSGAASLTFRQGDLATAQSLVAESLALQRDIDDRWGVATSLTNLGALTQMLGDTRGANELLEESLELFRELDDRQNIANTLNSIGILLMVQGEYEQAAAHLQESCDRATEVGDSYVVSTASINLARVRLYQGDLNAAEAIIEPTLKLNEELGDRSGIALLRSYQGIIAQARGEHERARALQEEALALVRELGDQYISALVLVELGLLALGEENFVGAQAHLEESYQLARGTGDKELISQTVRGLAHLALATHAAERAEALFRQSLALCIEIEDRRGVISALSGLAGTAYYQGRPGRSARLLGLVHARLALLGARLDPYVEEEYDRTLESVRATLVPARFQAAWKEGQETALTEGSIQALEQDEDRQD